MGRHALQSHVARVLPPANAAHSDAESHGLINQDGKSSLLNGNAGQVRKTSCRRSRRAHDVSNPRETFKEELEGSDGPSFGIVVLVWAWLHWLGRVDVRILLGLRRCP